MVESVPDAETNISSTFPSLELKTPESWFGGMYTLLRCTNNYSFLIIIFFMQQVKMGCIEVVFHPQNVQFFLKDSSFI